MNKFQILEVAEYLSIIAAIVGSVIAVSTNTLIYATVPMVLSILINLLLRLKSEQKIQQKLIKPIHEAYQQILNDIQSLHTSVLTISSQTNHENHENTEENNEKLSQLQIQYQTLQNTLNSLIYRMLSDGLLSSYKPQPEEQGIAEIINKYLQHKQEVKKASQL